MARAVAAFPAIAFVIAASGCLEIVDVLQPMEVRAGSAFEVGLVCKIEFDYFARDREPTYGYLGVSIPAGFDVREVNFRGAADGKLMPSPDLDGRPLESRPGYEWRVFGTRGYYRASDLAGHVLEVRVKLKAGKAPGDYLLAYGVGAAPVAAAGGPDVSRLKWDSLALGGAAKRWITVR
jgi:hypothetical protein